MTPSVEVEYTCKRCEAKARRLKVPARDPNKDVVAWLREVLTPVVTKDHADFNCPSEVFDLKILMPPDGEYIGQATTRSDNG